MGKATIDIMYTKRRNGVPEVVFTPLSQVSSAHPAVARSWSINGTKCSYADVGVMCPPYHRLLLNKDEWELGRRTEPIPHSCKMLKCPREHHWISYVATCVSVSHLADQVREPV